MFAVVQRVINTWLNVEDSAVIVQEVAGYWLTGLNLPFVPANLLTVLRACVSAVWATVRRSVFFVARRSGSTTGHNAGAPSAKR